MGFNIKTSELLIFARTAGVSFEKTITIGRQKMHGSDFFFKRLFQTYGFEQTRLTEIMEKNARYAEDFLRLLGAKKVESIDASGYEQATTIHDMNMPIPDGFKAQYSVVIDSGSLEHVFNFPVAIKNCMEMVEEGGHLICVAPANNFLGHGFYQFSPELFYRVASSENGFQPIKMFLFFNEYKSPIYEISDPMDVKQRVRLLNRKESMLFFIAKRIAIKPVLSSVPQQSDYAHIQWKASRETTRPAAVKKSPSTLRKRIPTSLMILMFNIRRMYWEFLWMLSPIGNGDRRYFKKVRLK